MTIQVNVGWRQLALVVAVVVAAVGLVVWWSSPARSQSGPGAVNSFAFVARADNPVDALAASSAAGQLGAPVYLTFPAGLDEQAAAGLKATDPQVVVLAGGTVALSEQVEQQIGELLPDATIRRFAGQGRTETAKLINELTGQLGVNRPVLAGATVTGDVGIDGTLTVNNVDVGTKLAALSARIDDLEADNADLTGRVAALEATLDGVTRTSVEGRDTLRFEAMNLQLVNGTGTTDGTPNGEGNLIIGYNIPRPFGATDPGVDRAGSHYLIVGDRHHWTRHGGIVAGLHNTASGDWASVTGGDRNTASGLYASVSGGQSNTASSGWASVSGGSANTASGSAAWVSGGQLNTASGAGASVSGGFGNTASFSAASVSGGSGNTASGNYASVSGGYGNTAADDFATVAGGLDGTLVADADNQYDSLIGNTVFADS